jgi:hypothetical protein
VLRQFAEEAKRPRLCNLIGKSPGLKDDQEYLGLEPSLPDSAFEPAACGPTQMRWQWGKL